MQYNPFRQAHMELCSFLFCKLTLIATVGFVLLGNYETSWASNESLKYPTLIKGINLLGADPVSVETENSRGVVVLFLSAKCPCSNSHIEEIKALKSKYAEFKFLAVHSNADESDSESRKYFESISLNFSVLQDKKAALADQFHALKTPHAFIVSPEGKLLFQGGVSDSHVAQNAKKHFLADALESIRKGQSPEVSHARTLGCIINR